MRTFAWKWREVTELVPVCDKEGNIGLLSEDDWNNAIDRASDLIVQLMAKEVTA